MWLQNIRFEYNLQVIALHILILCMFYELCSYYSCIRFPAKTYVTVNVPEVFMKLLPLDSRIAWWVAITPAHGHSHAQKRHNWVIGLWRDGGGGTHNPNTAQALFHTSFTWGRDLTPVEPARSCRTVVLPH